jgi:hypothetical protein
VTIVRVGSNEQYADNWDSIFGGRKSASKKTAKSSSGAKKASKKGKASPASAKKKSGKKKK